MNFYKSFFRRIIKDFKHKELLPLKILFFVHSSSMFVLYQYLTIHMRELGINIGETAIMSAITPIVAIIMPPLAGMVADRIGNFKLILAACSALGGGAALLLLLVPVGRVTITYPDRVIMNLSCTSPVSIQEPSYLHLTVPDNLPCTPVNDIMKSEVGVPLNTTLEACGFMCQHPGVSNISDHILHARHYNILLNNANKTTSTYTFILSPEDTEKHISSETDMRGYKMRNNDHYSTSIRKLGENSFFFPTADLYNLRCSLHESSYRCTFGNISMLHHGIESLSRIKKHFISRIMLETDENKGNPNLITYALSHWMNENGLKRNHTHQENDMFVNATCSNIYAEEQQTITASVPLHNPGNSLETDQVLHMESCQPLCLVTARRENICSNTKKEIEYDIKSTFWLYLIIRVFIGVIGGTAFAMFEGAVIAILREHNADYGLQRIYATIGGMISSPLSGIMIDYASKGKSYTDFRPAFYLYAALKVFSGFLMLTINLEFKPAAKNVVQDVWTVLKNIELVALFVAVFVLGTAWGYIENFLFWLLQDLGGSRSLMGITITVGGIAGIPLLVLSGPIIERFGHANVLFVGFIFYAIRLLGYSLIYNPWLCLVFEAMESVTSSLAITAAVTYAAKLSSTTTDSSIQGLLGGLYFGVGKGIGSLFGGFMMEAVGTRATYRVFSGISLVTGVTYYCFNRFYLSRQPQTEGNDIVKKIPPVSRISGDLVEIDLRNSNKMNGQENYDNKSSKNINTETFPINNTNSTLKYTVESDESKEVENLNYCNVAFVHDEDNENKGKCNKNIFSGKKYNTEEHQSAISDKDYRSTMQSNINMAYVDEDENEFTQRTHGPKDEKLQEVNEKTCDTNTETKVSD